MAGLAGRVGMMDVNKLKSRLYLATTTNNCPALASVHHEVTDGTRAACSLASQCATLRYSEISQYTALHIRRAAERPIRSTSES